MAVNDVNDQNPAFQLNDYFVEVHENLTFVCSNLKALAACEGRLSHFRVPL